MPITGDKNAEMIPSYRPVPLIVLTLPPEIGIDGRLEEPITLSTRLTRINNTLYNLNGYDTSVYLTLKGIPAYNPEQYHNKDYPGSQLFHGGDWDARDYGFFYWGPGSSPLGGIRPGHTDNPEVAITVKGLFWHDDRKTYTVNSLYDYKGAYDFYPWDVTPPFGDLDEEWEFCSKRRYDGDDVYLTISVTGSKHIGTTYTIPEILVSSAVSPSDSALENWDMGRPPTHSAHFLDFPLGMQLVAARLVFDNVSGVAPTIDTFTLTGPLSVTELTGRMWDPTTITIEASNAAPGTVTGYYFSENPSPVPLPIPNVFSATPPTEKYFASSGIVGGIDTGLRTMYLWVCNDTMDVSTRGEAEVFLCDVTRNGNPGRGLLYMSDNYVVGETSASIPIHLGMVTPNVGDALTYTITSEAYRDETMHTAPGTFTMVGDEIQLAVAPTDTSVKYYSCDVTVEDEHNNKALTQVMFVKPGYTYWNVV